MKAEDIMLAVVDGAIEETIKDKWHHEVKMDGWCGSVEHGEAYVYIDGKHYKIEIKEVE